MQAIVLTETGGIDRLQYTEIAIPKPKSDEVLIRVLYCGVNHLDLHIRAGRRPGIPSFPHILGSEIVGEIVAVPSGETEFRKKDQIAVYPWTFCGTCSFCTNGSEQICDRGGTIGKIQWGGYATHVVVPVRNLVNLPSGIDLKSACAVTLTGPTAYHLIQRANIPNKATVLLTGASGGVGTIVLQLLLQKQCRVICATSHPEKAAQLQSSGAWNIVASSNLQKDVAHLMPDGISYAIDLVGGSIWSRALQSLAKQGTIVFCATSQDDPAEIPLGISYSRELTILGSYGGSKKDLAVVLQLLREGKIQPMISKTYDLKHAAKAHEELEQQKNVGKILLRM